MSRHGTKLSVLKPSMISSMSYACEICVAYCQMVQKLTSEELTSVQPDRNLLREEIQRILQLQNDRSL